MPMGYLCLSLVMRERGFLCGETGICMALWALSDSIHAVGEQSPVGKL